MIDRTDIRKLRPAIPTIIESDQYRAAEQFQNNSLRPILKFQHDLLVAIFEHYLQKRKNKYFQLSPGRKQEYIEHSIRRDQRLKNLLLGTIIGLFTTEEYQQYLSEEKELRRRLTDLLVQRLQGVEFEG